MTDEDEIREGEFHEDDLELEEESDDDEEHSASLEQAMAGSFADRAIRRQRLRWRLIFLVLVFGVGFVAGRCSEGADAATSAGSASGMPHVSAATAGP